jgi:YesN/AraC family two-component response regulator
MLSETILLVDDEPAVLEGLQRLLHQDLRIETAVGGERGLEILQTNGSFAVVVSDMRMPLMDGAQFLSKVKALAPNVVRMMLTRQ